jgi:hypothetical protein
MCASNGSEVFNFEQTRFLPSVYSPPMKLLKVVPALIAVFCVAVLSLKRGTIFLP